MGTSEIVWDEEIEAGSGETRPTNNVDEIVVGEIHRGPIKNSSVSPNVSCCLWEEMGEKEGLEGSVSCV
jgi:hypothetical protein